MIGLSAPVISGDNRYIAFASSAQLLIEDTNPGQDIYIYDREDASLRLASVSISGKHEQQLASFSYPLSFSPDGERLLFESTSETLVPEDRRSNNDIYEKNLITGEVILVSSSANGTASNGNVSWGIYLDDNRVLLEAGQTSIGNGTDIISGSYIYIKNLANGQVQRLTISNNLSEVTARELSDVKLHRESETLFFTSKDGLLVPNDTNEKDDVFSLDLNSLEITRLNLKQDGSEIEKGSELVSVSKDGSKILFRSSDSTIVTGDTNNLPDIFMRDLATGIVSRINVSSEGEETWPNTITSDATFSPDGTKVLFTYFAQPHQHFIDDVNTTSIVVYVKDLNSGYVDTPYRNIETGVPISFLSPPIYILYWDIGIVILPGILVSEKR